MLDSELQELIDRELEARRKKAAPRLLRQKAVELGMCPNDGYKLSVMQMSHEDFHMLRTRWKCVQCGEIYSTYSE